MKIIDRTVREVMAAFRTSDPTPGGGSASALAGAVGASLLTMVAGLPKPVASTPADIQELHRAGARCSDLALQLEALVDKDAEAYDDVVAAYRMPKGTEEEKAARSAKIQDGLRGAIETPLEVMRACNGALEQATAIARLGNRNAASDVKVALALLQAGLRGALENVEINLGSVKDRDYAGRMGAEAANLLEGAGEMARRAAAWYQ